MSYVDILKALERRRLSEARSAVRALRSGCVPIIRMLVDATLDRLPYFPFKDRVAKEIADLLIAQVQGYCDYALEFIDLLDELIEWIGSPDALRAAADALLDGVDGPANDLLLEMKQTSLPSRYTWNDPPTSLKYADAAAAQPRELERLLPFIVSMRGILRQMADAIENFYLQLGTVILGLLGAIAGLVVAVTATGTIVGIPVAVVAAVGAVASLLVAIIALIQLCVTANQVQGNLVDTAKSSFTHTWANYAQFATIQ